MKVSLIIPVYNAEKTLAATLESIQAQRFRDFEVLFAEDACTDGSVAILQDFCRKSDLSCRLLLAERNGGAAVARNRALDVAQGEYLAFADADDLLEPDMLAHAVAAAATPDGPADVVGWDWTRGLSQGARYMRQADYTTPLQAFRGLTGGASRWNLWLFLIRRELVEQHHIRFVPGADIGEDMQFMLRAYMNAGKVVQLHEALYRWNSANTASISRSFTPAKRAQIETNLAEAERAFADSPFSREAPRAMTELKLYLKRPLLISPDKSDYETWYNWFPETNAHATEGDDLPRHTRILQGMAARRCWWGVRLYYVLIHKMVYGFIYR